MNRGQKIWQQVCSRQLPTQVKRLRILESPIFCPQDIEFPAYAAIVGPHGGGKSALSRILAVCFGSDIEWTHGPPFVGNTRNLGPSAVSGQVEVTVSVAGNEHTRSIDLDSSYIDNQSIWDDVVPDDFFVDYHTPVQAIFDIGTTLYQNLDYNYRYNRDKKFDQKSEVDFKSDDLANLRRILGREFTSLRGLIYYYDQDFPAFYASGISSKEELDIATMSLGEVWVLYALGFAMRYTNPGNMVILDEPETFLSHRGLRPFAQEIARASIKSEVQTIVATHSPEFLMNVPMDNILMCQRTSNGIQVRNPTSMQQVFESVGMQVPVKYQLLVEDEMARKIVTEALALHSPDILKQADILVCNGKDSVKSCIRTLARSEQRIRYIGILDGDQRPNMPTSDSNRSSMLYLPGGEPEIELVASMEQGLVELGSSLGRSPDDILYAISGNADIDHQKWFESMAFRLAVEVDVLTGIVIRRWLRSSSVAPAIHKLIHEIRSRLLA